MCQQEEYAESREGREQVLQILQSAPGDNSLKVAEALNNLAGSMVRDAMSGEVDSRKSKKEIYNATELYKESLELTKNKLGMEHPSIAATLNNIGDALIDLVSG